MGATEFIVAIELGSSKISGIAGKKLPDGSLQILATANENASGCFIQVVYNAFPNATRCVFVGCCQYL